MKNDDTTAFGVFNDPSPEGGNQSTRDIYEYEKHYMQLIKRYREDIDFINQCLRSVREEQEQMSNRLATINQQLDEALVDSDVKNAWLKHMTDNMNRSFNLSNDLLEHFYRMKFKEFETELTKRLKK